MKNSKFWIWFIPLILIISIGIYFGLVKTNQNNNSNNNKSDATRIKEEYSNKNDYYKVSLNDSNVYKYISVEDLKELLDKKDGLVFIGNPNDNISRKAISALNDVVLSTSIPEVYYIDINNVNDQLKSTILDKAKISNINSGTLISIESGNILKVYYPSEVLNNNELSESEKQSLYDIYKKIVNNFIEECDENC